MRSDPEQRLVIDHRSGPLLVLGGPGTGKTTMLIEAVASRVVDGVEPDRILVLTFGRRAAGTLRDQIETRIGQRRRAEVRDPDAPPARVAVSEPVVRTFPAYAFGLLRQAAAERGEPAPRLLTGAEQDAVIRDLLSEPDAVWRWPPSLRHAVRTRAFAAELRDLILRCAERGIGARALAELGRSTGREDWVAAARFLREYGEVLALRDATTRGSVAFDQAELVRAAASMLTDDAPLLRAERHRWAAIYVDELAETDPAQMDLLALVGAGCDVVGFADPDSSTFAFRGADLSGVREFATRFPTASGAPAPRIVLRTSHRSAPDLVTAGRRVAARLRGPVRHRDLTAAVTPGTEPTESQQPPVEVCTLRSPTSEAAYVAHWLREAHVRHGIAWSRMAVIVRSLHLHQAGVRRALTQSGVPVVTLAEETALAQAPAVAPFLLLLRRSLDPTTLVEEDVVALLHSSLGGADPFTERRLRQGLRDLARAAGDPRPSGELLVEAVRDRAHLAAIDQRWVRPARAVADLVAIVGQASARPHATAEDVLWAVWRASGLAARWATASAEGGLRGAAADRDLDAMMVLFDAAARFTDRLPGARIEAFLDHVQDQQLPADTLAATADSGQAVRLLTAHGAKGLEWDAVAVVGVQEGIWPDLRLRGSVLGSERLVDISAGRPTEVASQVSALLDEERRLFYVAVSRAGRRLLVTAVDATGTGGGGEEQPSRFLHELSFDVAADPDLSPAAPDADAAGSDLGADDGPGIARGELKRPLTLPALVAELRTVVTDETQPERLRAGAAERLATLAAAGVPGADPDQWWGLRPLSDERPLADAGEKVKVTPSTVESVLRCGLRWLLERHGGSEPPTANQSIGNLVHAAAMLAQDPDFDPAAVRQFVSDRFDGIELPAVWLTDRERARADTMVDKLLRWLADNPRTQLAIERDFEQSLPSEQDVDAQTETLDVEVVLRGRVDRLEADSDGRLVVVDLKTGASAPTAADAQAHPQLAAYQAAVEAGAFPEGTQPGGAEIVAVGTPTAAAAIRVQSPLDTSDDPAWARALVRRAASAMAASSFRAVVNDSCRYCSVRTSCPVSGKGRQVGQA